MIGTVLGQFRILDRLGAGGMGEVYRAHDSQLDREVALKVLPPEAAGDRPRLLRFQQEARLLANLDHPNLVGVFSVDEHDGIPFIAMPLVRGRTLDAVIPAGGMDTDAFLRLALQMVDGLAAAHARGVVHRDLKPANVMVADDGRVRILDFGLAKLLDPSPAGEATVPLVSRTGEVAGTVAYMSPEQIDGHEVDERTDVFSLGVIFHEMLSGRHPFRSGTTSSTIAAILRTPPATAPRDDLPSSLVELCRSCLERTASNRPDTGSLRARMEELGQYTAPPEPGRPPSIAVLPFTDLSPQKDQEYFCEGMAEEILTGLSRLRSLEVASRTSSSRYRGTQKDCRTIGRELGVGALLEGSVRKSGNRLRITAQLVDTRTDRNLWSGRYDRELEDVFAIQEDIAENLVASLELTLAPDESEALHTPPSTNPQAYDFYLRGRTSFRRDTRSSLEAARRMFRHALDLDPDFVQAWAGFADSTLYLYKHFLRDAPLLDEAEQACNRALALDPDSAEAHTSRAVVHWLKGEDEGAAREFERAVALDPTLFETRYHMAQWCLTGGRIEDAAAHFAKASELLPEDYQSPILLGSMHRALGRAHEAESAFRRGVDVAREQLEANPEDVRAWYLGAGALVAIGETTAGLQWAEQALALDGENPLLLLNLAAVHGAAGRIDEAVDLAEAAAEHGFEYKPAFENDPDLEPLREHPRYRALLDRL